MRRPVFVVGGGISGMMASLLLARKGVQVTLLEGCDQLGGLLQSFNYGPSGYFDYGVHIPSDTGLEELDDILFGLLPKEDWSIFVRQKRDLVGVHSHGKLHLESPYLDARALPVAKYKECLADFFRHLGKPSEKNSNSAFDEAEARFGSVIANELVAPALEQVFKFPAKQLSTLASAIIPTNRIVLFGPESAANLTQSEILREKIGFVDQRNLPGEWCSPLRSYYPKKFGMFRIIEKLRAHLIGEGVQILVNAHIKDFRIESGRIAEISYSHGDQVQQSRIDHLFWSAGLFALAKTLGIVSKAPSDPPLRTVTANFLLSRPLDAGDVYYFYCYEPGFATFRVTNYANYCREAVRDGAYPVTMELILRDGENLESERLCELAKSELRDLSVLAGGSEILFGKAEVLRQGFPTPTIKNMHFVENLRTELRARGLVNLTSFGVMSEPNIFFQNQVLQDMHRKVSNAIR